MLITVITVVYNNVSEIERTIKSVLEQSEIEIEYIIIDGGSKDGTVEIIRKYESNLTKWVSESDGGTYDAMNKGIGMSKGDYIGFLNSGDTYEKNALSQVVDYLKKASISPPIIYGKVRYIESGKEDGYIGISSPEDNENIHFGNIYCHQGLFISKALFETVGLYGYKYKYLADYEWILRAHDMGIDPEFVDCVVASYVSGGLSNSKDAYREMYTLIAENYSEHIPFTKELQRRIGFAEFNLLYMDRIPEFQSFFEEEKSYYIWGYGEIGVKIYNILTNIKNEVVGFISSERTDKLVSGLKVYSLSEVMNMVKVCKEYRIVVATEKYEDEVIEVINQFGIKEANYITISEIYAWAYKRYRENE